TAVFTRVLGVSIYGAVYTALSVVPIEQAREFWTSCSGWLLALLFYDFCYYWRHRAGHESAIFWAAHVVHHQSQDYNLSTALRQSSSNFLLDWVFYLPMAVAGVPPLVFGVVVLVDLLYQFWVHTEHVPKLGWFDRWFCSPSNHRVHHAVNDCYIDRNYGGVLIIWDRMFGSFKEEDEKCVYGTRSPLNSWDPLWSNAEVYWALVKDSWHARNWLDKLRVWFKPPGWRPADVAARYPKPPFEFARMHRYHPPLARGVAWFGAIQFALLLGGVALATATGAQSLMQWHLVFKPLVMLLAIFYVADPLHLRRSPSRFDLLLMGGLACSLVGDCFLMLPGFFIPGLVSFLLAHLFYIALFRQGVPWLPSRRALLVTLGIGAAMYAFLFDALNPVLKIAVAAYVVVIALMAAQAIGRATLLRDKSSMAAAVGAGFFMLSDSLLATNKFAFPLPMAQFWVLATYYAAQILITCNAVPDGAGRAPHPSQESANSSPALFGGATPK